MGSGTARRVTAHHCPRHVTLRFTETNTASINLNTDDHHTFALVSPIFAKKSEILYIGPIVHAKRINVRPHVVAHIGRMDRIV